MPMKNAYWKDIWRTVRREKKRFLSIAVIAALGVTMMCGLRASCEDLRYSADQFFDEQKLFDVRILSTLGLEADDITELAEISEVGLAEGGYNETVYTVLDEVKKSIDLRTLSDSGLNQPYLLEGELPKKIDEIAITKSYYLESGKSVGDEILLQDEPEMFKAQRYKITGIIIDTLDVNSNEGSMGFRSTATTDYVGYVIPEAADSEIYTVAYLQLKQTSQLNCYSEEYQDAVDQVVDKIEQNLKAEREEARYEELYQEAMAEYLDGKAEMEEEFTKAEKEIADAREELADGRKQLEDGRITLEQKKSEMESGKEELAGKKKELEDGKKALADNRKQLEDGQAEIKRLRKAADEAFTDAEVELQEQEKALNAGYTQYQEGKTAFERQKQLLMAQVDQIDQALQDPRLTEEARAAYEKQKSDILAGIESGEKELKESYEELEAGRIALEEGKEELTGQRNHTYENLDAEEEKIRLGLIELEKAEAELLDGESQLLAAEQTLKDGETELKKAEAELLENEATLSDGEKELEENVLKFQEEKAKAEKELADAKEEIDDIPKAKWYVQDRTTLSGYTNVKSDANSIQAIGDVFPVLFLVVAILISLTTITRMVEEERGLIGTYKALGFTNVEIRRKYILYAALACLLGGVIGDFAGYVVLPAIIFIVFHVMYQLPEYAFQFDLVYGLGGILFFEVGVLAATLYSCKRALSHTPATLMRPKTPKAGSRVFLERIRFIWKRLSFLNKVTARNLFRYKKRMLMTIFGIAGCTGLLLCGFTIKNTVSEMMPQQYEVVYKYDLMAVTAEDDFAELEDILIRDEEVGDYLPLRIESVDIFNETGKKETVQLMVIPEGESIEDYIHLKTKAGEAVSLEDTDVLLTRNATRTMKLSLGDEIRIQNLDLRECDAKITGIVENYFGNIVYMTEAKYETLFGIYETNGVLAKFTNQCKDDTAYTENLKREEIILSANCTQAMKDEFSSAFRLLNMVVGVVLVLAALLAFVVLFTLSNTNISERERELATIKVLGFYHPEVHSYVNKETWILTVMGILLGMPLGWLLGRYVMGILEFSSLEFYIALYPQSYLYAAMITVLFGIIVNFITNKVLDKINMVEALKSVE